MRKLVLLAGLTIGLFSCGSKDDTVVGFKTTMSIQSVFDAGKVAKGELIHAKFQVENTGENPLILSDVKGSCTCTVADFSKDPIAPGEKGFIKATVKTEGASTGSLSKSITVLANTTPASTTIAVKATIIK